MLAGTALSFVVYGVREETRLPSRVVIENGAGSGASWSVVKTRQYIFKAKGMYLQPASVVDGLLFKRMQNAVTSEEASEIVEISPFARIGRMPRR